MFHLHEKGNGLYTSTDGYYIRNILESASELSPVVLLTDHGWMGHDGIKVAQNLYLNSKAYSYWLSSNIDAHDIIAFLLRREGMIISCGGGASAYYVWAGRPSPPTSACFSNE